jgi:leucyl-tRNA synthetase
VVVQVNGKVRDRLQVPADNSEDANVALALSREPMAKILAGKSPRKVIYVPQKLLNIVPLRCLPLGNRFRGYRARLRCQQI